MKIGTEIGGLGFVPYRHSVSKRDFMPGNIDFRMVNEMEQTISALSVRYSLQYVHTSDRDQRGMSIQGAYRGLGVLHRGLEVLHRVTDLL